MTYGTGPGGLRVLLTDRAERLIGTPALPIVWEVIGNRDAELELRGQRLRVVAGTAGALLIGCAADFAGGVAAA